MGVNMVPNDIPSTFINLCVCIIHALYVHMLYIYIILYHASMPSIKVSIHQDSYPEKHLS